MNHSTSKSGIDNSLPILKSGDISSEDHALEPVHGDEDFVGEADLPRPVGSAPQEECKYAFDLGDGLLGVACDDNESEIIVRKLDCETH